LRPSRLTLAVTITLTAALAAPAYASADSLVTTGSPPSPFSQNKQNEPAVAIDPVDPTIQVAGSNDELDLAPCGFPPATTSAPCPFTPGVGVSGVYFSTDGGQSWSQPTYQGYSARSGTAGPGPIGTLPNYYEAGLASDGDPGLAFGPKLINGTFTYDQGAELYYSNLTANFATVRSEQAFRGFEAIAVSRTGDLSGAEAGDNSAWSSPVIVSATHQSSTTFSDKPGIWADNAESSHHFGNVYECYTQFRSQKGPPEPIAFSRSTDGGQTFSSPMQLSQAADNSRVGGRQGCQVRTDSQGNVYVFWEGAYQHHSEQLMAKSTDGGVHFGQPQPVAPVVDVGAPDQTTGDVAFDGVAGARTDSFPSVDIANGAPSGSGAPDTIAVGWSDGALNNESSLVVLSGDGGKSWTAPQTVSAAGDRPDMTAVAISPNGQDLYVDYDNFLSSFQTDTSQARPVEGVVRHGDLSGTSLGNLNTVSVGATGDARASSANSLTAEFLGDYNYVAATNSGATAVYNDARNATDCPAVDAFREALVGGQSPTPPNPATDCGPAFGNSDIYAAVVTP
jgi:hypothetical protein